jgi:hypothetical protein
VKNQQVVIPDLIRHPEVLDSSSPRMTKRPETERLAKPSKLHVIIKDMSAACQGCYKDKAVTRTNTLTI